MGINLLEMVKQSQPFTEDEARQLLVTTTKRIMRDWPQGALIASEGTPLFEEYQKASDAVDKAFEGTREDFLKALTKYENVMMKIADSYRQGG